MQRHEETVAVALELFWRKGYTDTSMADIVAATGTNRYALYSRFQNKRDIFLAALAAYFERGRALFEPMLTDPKVPPITRLATALDAMIDMVLELHNGCFICHVAVEHSAEDPAIGEAVGLYFGRILEVIEKAMRDAEEAGQLNPALTPAIAAQVFFDVELGLGVRAKAGASRDDLATTAAAMLMAISAPGAATPDRLAPLLEE